MQTPVAFEVHYSEYQRQTAWINENDWQFEKTGKHYRVRTAVAKTLIALAARIAPTVTQANPRTPALAQ